MKLTVCKGGTGEKEIDTQTVEILDLWHVAMWLQQQKQDHYAAMVLDVWHLCHELKDKLNELPNFGHTKE